MILGTRNCLTSMCKYFHTFYQNQHQDSFRLQTYEFKGGNDVYYRGDNSYVYFRYYHLHNNLLRKDPQKENGECHKRSLEGLSCFIVDLTIFILKIMFAYKSMECLHQLLKSRHLFVVLFH